MSDAPDDSGPAFPVQDASTWQAFGLSKRELFAVILMHSEAVTCGVPGKACEALVEASREAGDDVIDHMAKNAVMGAEALLRALAAPLPARAPEYRDLRPSEQYRLDAGEKLYAALLAVKQSAGEPADRQLSDQITEALHAWDDSDIPF